MPATPKEKGESKGDEATEEKRDDETKEGEDEGKE